MTTKLYSTAQIRQLEQTWINLSEDSFELMARAGQAAFDKIQQQWCQGHQAKTMVVFCGAGNNAGDGYVVARLAKTAGYEVTVYFLKDPHTLQHPAKQAADEFLNQQGDCQPLPERINLQGVDIIVDALLGTGLTGEVREHYLRAINAINGINAISTTSKGKTLVFALDIPSGIDSDTGALWGNAVRADATMTFIGVKQGMFTGAAPSYCGELFVDTLGIPQTMFTALEPTVTCVDYQALKQHYLGKRPRHSNKGYFGHVLVIGGDIGMGGAVHMAAEASARTGSGLTSVATRQQHVSAILANRPEIMVRAIQHSEELIPLLERATVMAIGPGLGQSAWSEGLFKRALMADIPIVVDADGLNLLQSANIVRSQWVLTPHPGEAARLLNTTVAKVQQDRYKAVRQLQQFFGGTVILKGAGTLICGEQGQVKMCLWGNPGMASGGMGDVLTGTIASLIAQEVPLFEAACLGVCIHAQAADAAAHKRGERGLLALDVVNEIGPFIND